MHDACHVLERIHRGLIVSCQASEGDPLYGPDMMTRMAMAAKLGGAVGIRANGGEDIRRIKEATGLPVIGIVKRRYEGSDVYITATMREVVEVVAAGADVVAVDATSRMRPEGLTAAEFLRRVKQAFPHVLLMADVATVDEGVAAAAAGADLVASTMAGYTPYSPSGDGPDFALLRGLVEAVPVPVIAEGRIQRPEQARTCIELGCWAVVVGSAITRPQEITRMYAAALAQAGTAAPCAIGIDIGGTKIAAGLVDATGCIQARRVIPTPAAGKEAILAALPPLVEELRAEALARGLGLPAGVGVGAAGQVDVRRGTIRSGTPNIPNWSDVPIVEYLEQACGLPAWVDNDVNAMALAEGWFGAARGHENFVCLALGTGIGGGVVTGGRLLHGAWGGAAELGHMSVHLAGPSCNCGHRGCLEAYASGRGLVERMREALAAAPGSVRHGAPSLHPSARNPASLSAEMVFRWYRSGDPVAVAVVDRMVQALAVAVINIAHIFNPTIVVLGGGIVAHEPWLCAAVAARIRGAGIRSLVDPVAVVPAALREEAGVVGAAALCWTMMEQGGAK